MRFLSLFLIGLPLVAATVEGVVTNSITGLPVPHAHVMLDGLVEGRPGRYGATAGADGRFSIADLPAGSYSPSAERIGFVLSGSRGRNRIALKEGDDKNDVEIKLTPTGAIAGRVTDADGEPLEGVNVTAEGARSGESGTTDAQGQFRIGGLAPGKYRVRASKTGYVFDGPPEKRTDGTAEVHYASTYYPGAIDEKEAGRVEVRPAGESTGVNIQLLSVPFVRVSGKVVGMPRGAEGVNVMVWHGGGGTGTSLKPDGRFEIWRLDPGDYKLRAEWKTPTGDAVQTAGVEIEVARSNIDDIELRVVPDSDIPGRLEFEDDQLKQASLKAQERMVTLSMTGAESDVGISARAGGDDIFHFEKVPAGKYRVGLSWETAYVKAVRLGSTIIDGPEIDLSNGSGGADLSLVLGASNGSISGTVTSDDGNAATAHVVLRDARTESEFMWERDVPVKADGGYSFTGLPPGSYQVIAVPVDDPAGVYATEHDDAVEQIELGPGQKATRDLKLKAESQ